MARAVKLRVGAARAAEQVYGSRFRAHSKWSAGLAAAGRACGWHFFRFVTRRVKVFDEVKLGAAVFATASIRRRKS